jgi:DNA-binding SARP family transcriptional activator
VGRAKPSRIIHQEPGWVGLNLDDRVWVDTVALEDAFNSTRGRCSISAEEAQELVDVIQLYRGDLLEGQGWAWCAYERDRFRQMYLTLLDKLVGHCTSHDQYDAGIAFAMLALQCDRVRERTHRNLMELRFLAGDRTGALRQYERCAALLQEELEVRPSHETEELHATICRGTREGTNGGDPPATPLFVVGNAASASGGRRPTPRVAMTEGSRATKKLV